MSLITMKILKKKLSYSIKIFLNIVFLLFISFTVNANEIEIEVNGNNFTDKSVIFSLIEYKPIDINEEYSNYLIKTLQNSNLF